MTVVN